MAFDQFTDIGKFWSAAVAALTLAHDRRRRAEPRACQLPKGRRRIRAEGPLGRRYRDRAWHRSISGLGLGQGLIRNALWHFYQTSAAHPARQEPDLLRVHLQLCAAAAVGDVAGPDLGAEAILHPRRPAVERVARMEPTGRANARPTTSAIASRSDDRLRANPDGSGRGENPGFRCAASRATGQAAGQRPLYVPVDCLYYSRWIAASPGTDPQAMIRAHRH